MGSTFRLKQMVAAKECRKYFRIARNKLDVDL